MYLNSLRFRRLLGEVRDTGSPRPLLREAVLATLRVALRGNGRYVCPCCDARLLRLVPRLYERMCPGCRSLERHRFLWLWVRGLLEATRGRSRVLHIAPEPALYRCLSADPAIDYVTGDLEASALVDEQLDARALPFPESSFDLVICSHVLEHIQEDVDAAREFRRVLRPEGELLIQVPVDHDRAETFEDGTITTPEARELAYGQSDHVRVYGTDVAERLSSAGLLVTRITAEDALPPEVRRRHVLDERSRRRGSDIFSCVPA